MDNQKYTLARSLRKNATKQEQILWNVLKNRQFHCLKFKRQVPINKYIVDFACKEIGLIIELDGGQHNYEENIISDKERTENLEKLGYTVARFWNNEITENLNGVLEELEKYL